VTGVPDDGGRETDADPVRVRVGRSEGAGPRVVRTGPAVELADCTPGDLPDVDARREDPNGASCDVAADTGEGDGDGGTPTPAGRPALNPETVLAAVRGTDPVGGVRVECPPPGPVHEYVGLVGREPTLNLRGALAAAARSRGHVAPNRETLRRARQTLREFETASDVTGAIDEAKRRVAEASEREATLRERVSTLRGRVVALREAYGDGPDAATGDDPEENDPNGDASGRGPTVPSGEGADRDHHRAESTGDERADATGREPAVDDDPVAAAEAAYRDAVRELSEVETERIAGEQRLARLREVARETRDERDRRLRLEDRVANLERRVRLSLAQSVYGEFAAAVDRLPGAGAAGDAPGEYEGPPATAALAVVRVADTAAPVVLAGRRFPDARTASERLRAPVVRL
jgi:hypothetical protein